MEGAWSLSEDANVPARAAPSLAERFEAEVPAVRGYLRALAGRGAPAADVDDLVQDVFARAWRSRAGFDDTRPLRPWLRATALRAWIDLLRERARRTELEATHARSTPTQSAADQPIEELESVEKLLASLDAIERDVLLRFHRRGESVRAIAAALECPEGTVKSLLHRARKKLARRAEERP